MRAQISVGHRKRSTVEPRRDWRLAALGSGCCALGIACLMLVACSAAPQRPVPPPASVPMLAPPAEPVAPVPEVANAIVPAEAAIVQSPWERLRRRLAMPGCDYSPAVKRFTHLYAQSPAQFEASMSEAMPYFLVVLNEIEKRDLPGEFAFLPYIESTYTPISSNGDRAAGIWQLMPDTARETGLPITPEYDGRLDIYASTKAALDLLERYQREFEDWRVVDLAYNAGEYGVKNSVGANTSTRTANQIAQLHVNPGAHDHLAKLLAVACVASDPDRFHIELPEPSSDDILAHVELEAPVDLNLVAWISGIDIALLRRYNPGYTLGRMPANGPYGLLVPSSQRDQIEAALAKLPKPMWREWHEISLQQDEPVNLIADARDLDANVVASINHVAANGVIQAGKHVLVPGRADGGLHPVAETMPTTAAASSHASNVHVVRSGDTLWNVARSEHIRLNDLLRWNKLQANSKLHIGQRLRLQDSSPEGSTSALAGGAD